jgi:hypothetical protein
MSGNPSDPDAQVKSISIRFLESQMSKNLSEEDISKINGGLAIIDPIEGCVRRPYPIQKPFCTPGYKFPR